MATIQQAEGISMIEESALISGGREATTVELESGRGTVIRVSDAADFDDTDSGDKEIPIETFAPGSRVTKATARVSGGAFGGLLKNLKGAKVTASPVIYNTEGQTDDPSSSEKAFLIDFSGIRSILKLKLPTGKGLMTLVLPWLGTEFSPRPAFGGQKTSGGVTRSVPDIDGRSVVGLTGIETTKLLVQLSDTNLDASTFANFCQILTATYPSNVKASINGRLPFWTHPGVLDEQAEITGLADDLNALLKDVTAPTPVKLLLTTDTPGVLKTSYAAASDLAFEREAGALWGGQEAIEVLLQALVEQTVELPFPAKGIKAWRVNAVTLNLAGAFPPWRAFSAQTTALPGKLGMKISAKFSVARRFAFSEDGELYGFSILMRPSTESSELQLQVVTEKDGQPDFAKPLATADLSLEAATADAPRWIDVVFASPTAVKKNKGFWLAAKAKTGVGEWVGATEAPNVKTTTLYNNEGGQWQRYPLISNQQPVAQLRILRRPFAKENQPLLDISMDAPPASVKKSVEIDQETLSVEIALPAGTTKDVPPVSANVTVPLRFLSRSSGTLTIKSAAVSYKEK
jgi:hypothetical protein